MAEVVSPNGHPTPVPVVQPEVKVWWDATAQGKLILPTCSECATVIWFPRPFCPSCGSLSIDWSQEASGNGIRSAVAAGMTVIAIPNRDFPPDDEALALVSSVLRSLDELRTFSL